MKTKTIPAEYLSLRLDQVMRVRATASDGALPKSGPVAVARIVAAVRGLADQIAKQDAAQHQQEVAWALAQLDKVTTSLPARQRRARRAAKQRRHT